MDNKFERTIGLIGEAKFNKITTKTLLIFGLGGVGGTAFEALVRTGFNKFVIVDFDKVSESNLNRQILYTSKDINKNKCDVAKERALQINEQAEIINLNLKVDENSVQELEKYDVDCFVGYVYFTLNPNYVVIGLISFVGIVLVILIVLGIIKGTFKKIFHSKKFKLICLTKGDLLDQENTFAFLLIFSYIPMTGIIIAFKNYRANDGIFHSEWTAMFGFKNFYNLFTSPTSEFGKLMKNTFVLAFWKFIFGFVIAITLAVLFNYLKDGIFKKTVQTISYFPYFISWVVISTLSYVLLATDGGTFNKILMLLNKEPINFYSEPKYWVTILTSSAMWKTAGYSTIVYLAAMAGIDKSVYEAARIDGANEYRIATSIILPLAKPAFASMGILCFVFHKILQLHYMHVLLLDNILLLLCDNNQLTLHYVVPLNVLH